MLWARYWMSHWQPDLYFRAWSVAEFKLQPGACLVCMGLMQLCTHERRVYPGVRPVSISACSPVITATGTPDSTRVAIVKDSALQTECFSSLARLFAVTPCLPRWLGWPVSAAAKRVEPTVKSVAMVVTTDAGVIAYACRSDASRSHQLKRKHSPACRSCLASNICI